MKSRRHMKLPRRRKRYREVPVEARVEQVCGPNVSEPTCSPVTQSGRPSPFRAGEGSTRREVGRHEQRRTPPGYQGEHADKVTC